MTKDDAINFLNSSLRNEVTHWYFYTQAQATVAGIHRLELREWLVEQAESEHKHIMQFSNVIKGLGGSPQVGYNYFPPNLSNPYDILQYALRLEEEVVQNYNDFIEKLETEGNHLSRVDKKYLEVFLEDQIQHSREDADEIKMMLLI